MSIAKTPVRRPMGTAISAFECWLKSRPTTPRSIVALYTPCALSGFFCPTELTGNTGTPACASDSAASRIDPTPKAAQTAFPNRAGSDATGNTGPAFQSVLAALRAAALFSRVTGCGTFAAPTLASGRFDSRGCFIERLLKGGQAT
jgi:hypothetical protein